MTKVNLKNILTAVRDMIMRNRVAYKDYLGTDENGNKIYDTKLVPVELLPNIPSKLLPKTLATKREVQAVEDTANDALSTAYTAQTAADNAQSTAYTAQTAADNAQTAADNAQTAADNAVKYTTSQDLTDAQKQQARTNIGAGTSSFSGSYNDLTDKPTAVQSDWEVNNDSNVAYIKNRTHYERTEYSSISFRNNPIASSPINDIYYYGEKTGSSLSIDEGNIYKVNGNDGNIYISTCQRVPIPGLVTGYAGYVLGNARLGVDAGYLSGTNSSYPITDTGEPWCFISYKNTAKNAIISTISNFRIGSIYVQTAHELKQLDEKYIPSTIQRVGDDLILLSSTPDSTKKFKITVDDSGTPSLTNAEDSAEVWSGATHSAYAAAQAGGYTDTEVNFYADLAAVQGLAAELAAI